MKKQADQWLFESLGPLAMIAAAVASVIVVIVVVVPLFSEAWEGLQSLADREEELEQLANRVAILSDYNEDELKQQLAVSLDALPVESDLPLTVGVMSTLADEVGVEVLEAAAADDGREATGGTLKEQRIRLTVSGDPETLELYLQELAKVAPILQVPDTRLVWSTQEGQEQEVRADMSVRSFAMELVEPDEKMLNSAPIPIFDASEVQIYQDLRELRKIEPAIEIETVSDDGRNPFKQN